MLQLALRKAVPSAAGVAIHVKRKAGKLEPLLKHPVQAAVK